MFYPGQDDRGSGVDPGNARHKARIHPRLDKNPSQFIIPTNGQFRITNPHTGMNLLYTGRKPEHSENPDPGVVKQ